MGSHSTECSSLVRFMDAMAEKHEKMQQQKRSNATFATQLIDTSNSALLAKQKADTAKALKAAMKFDFSKLKTTSLQKPAKVKYQKKRKFDKQKLIKKIIKLHKQGMLFADIVRATKIPRSTARTYLIEAGYTPIKSIKKGAK